MSFVCAGKYPFCFTSVMSSLSDLSYLDVVLRLDSLNGLLFVYQLVFIPFVFLPFVSA